MSSLSLTGVSVAAGSAKILADLSLELPAGGFAAIMGPSGAGKTSLLNVLAGRLFGRVAVSGEVRVAGQLRPTTGRTAHSGYVLQHPRLADWLSCKETLSWAAAVGLGWPGPARRALVADTLAQLGLERATGRVGQLSGGERRRLAIGVQLVSKPRVLFLDEPTTGLDAAAALRVVRVLSELAAGGCTVVCSIHQPRSDIYAQFRLVCLLAGGRALAIGSPAQVSAHLSQLGHRCPVSVNPADFIIDLVTVDTRTESKEQRSRARLEQVAAAQPILLQQPPALAELEYEAVPAAPALQQLAALLVRGGRRLARDRPLVLGGLVQSSGIGIMIGLMFLQLGGSQGDVQISRKSLLYLVGAMGPYISILFTVFRLCEVDMPIFDAEADDRAYRPWCGVLVQRVIYLPLELAQSLLYGCSCYFLTGLRLDDGGSHMLIFLMGCFWGQLVGSSIAACAVSITRNFDLASLIANSLYTFMVLSGGFLMKADTVPVYLAWIKRISFQWVEFQLFAINEYRGNSYDPGVSGDAVLEQLGLSGSTTTSQLILVLLLHYVAYQLITTVLMLSHRVHAIPALAGTGASSGRLERRPEQHGFFDGEGPSQLNVPELRAATQGLKLVQLSVVVGQPKRSDPSKESLLDQSGGSHKLILDHVDAEFPAGCFSVVMGPSGSGKTSTLRAVAGHIGPPVVVTGSVLFNHQPLNRSKCGFVMQDDDLMIGLTARETLIFAARISSSSVEQVDKLLFELCLPDCAHTLVASCSGGERRRISVACQMVKSPSLLLLDEPTSGLDAATARYLVETLCSLAQLRHTTIIASIHQPRSDIMALVTGSVALIAQGQCVYHGNLDGAIQQFTSQGFPFPECTNPADYLLDILADGAYLSSLPPSGSVDAAPTSEPVAPSQSQEADSPQATPVCTVIGLLIWRSVLNSWRQPHLVAARIGQPLALAVILTLFFAHKVDNIQNRVGLLYEWQPFIFVGMLTCIANFPAERNVYLRDRHDGHYNSTSFLLAYMCIEIPCSIFGSFLCSALFCYVIGLTNTIAAFLESALVIFLVITNGETAGLIFCSAIKHAGFAVSIVSIWLSLLNVMCGWFRAGGNLPAVLEQLNFISPLKYAAAFSGIVQFDGVTFHETIAGREQEITGDEVLDLYGFSVGNKWSSLLALAGITVGLRLVAFVALRYLPDYRNF